MARTRGQEKFKADTARRALLDAGRELLTEVGVSPALERVTLKDAIDRSGVPRTTAYRLFSDSTSPLQTFRNALLAELDEPVSVDATVDLVAQLLDDARPILESRDPKAMADLLREMIRVGFNHRVELLASQTQWRTYVATSAGLAAGPNNPFTSAAQDVGAVFVPLFESIGTAFGIRPIPPMSWAGLCGILVAALDGGALRTIVDSDFTKIARPVAPDGGDASWNGAAVLAEGLMLIWCEPDPLSEVSADLSTWSSFGPAI